MVTGRAIPKNSTCLRGGDYLPYLRAALRTSGASPNATDDVFGSLLPDRRLIATPTGRHALWTFLQVAQLREGDEILVAAYNFYVIVRLLIQRGLVPVFVDVEPETLCMDPNDLLARIGPRSRLVLPTHIFGHPANLSRIGEICREHNLLLFEDCAHAVGTLHEGRQVGQAGDGGLLAVRPEMMNGFASPAINVSRRLSIGDTFTRFIYSAAMSPRVYRHLVRPAARALSVVSPSAQKKVREFFEPSKDDPAYRFHVESRPPFKPFMAEMQARQLHRLAENVSRRRALVERMRRGLARIQEIRLLDMDRHGRANASYFVAVVPDPYGLVEHLRQRGVGAHPQEFLDCSRLEQFRPYQADCPAARHASGSVVRLPSYPSLSDADADHIVESVAAYFTSAR
jgi:dTDP-4-amino-4,6-dideoxygalactose transaminase